MVLAHKLAFRLVCKIASPQNLDRLLHSTPRSFLVYHHLVAHDACPKLNHDSLDWTISNLFQRKTNPDKRHPFVAEGNHRKTLRYLYGFAFTLLRLLVIENVCKHWLHFSKWTRSLHIPLSLRAHESHARIRGRVHLHMFEKRSEVSASSRGTR